MQYILTQEEFDQIKADAAKAIKKVQADLQAACTLLADNMPVTAPWRPNTKAIWGCILTVTHEHRCDHCPVQKICPHPDKLLNK